MNLELLRQYAMTFCGVPYKWGGKSRNQGMDCSHFVCELLKSTHLVSYNYYGTAQNLYDLLIKDSTPNKGGLGALAFYGKDPFSIVHVGFCLDNLTMLEAGGGNSQVVDLRSAIENNACIKMMPITYRKDFLCVLFPKYL